MYRIKEKLRGVGAWILMAALIWGMVFPWLPVKTVLADSGTVLAWSGEWHHYCIDGSGYAHNTASTKNDKYMRVNTQDGLNSQERAILFWAMLSFKAAYCHDAAAAGRIAAINEGAQAAGLKPIVSGVSEEDLKGVIHSSKVRAKYGWLDDAVDRGESYLRLAGFLGGSGKGGSTNSVPSLLQNATSLEKAVQAAGGEGKYVLDFDSSGKDGDFLAKVPLKLSADGVNWTGGSVNGWNVQKTATQVCITNPDPQAQPVYLKFDPSGTDYALSSGGFGSPDECYSQTLQVWKCVECAGTHATGGKVHPLENHQRTIWMELTDIPVGAYYGMTGKGNLAGPTGELHFQMYRHEEEMDADYLVQLYKYDYETGAPLEGAVFDLYERFDDKDQVNQENCGQGEIYEQGLTHTPVVWDGFRLVTSVQTDANGHGSYRLEKGYHYDKTFCDGHPAPVFGGDSQEDDGEENWEDTSDGERQGSVKDAAGAYSEDRDEMEGEEETEEETDGAGNAELAREWMDCVAACEARAQDGTHFHWIMDEVDEDAIEAAASSGESGDMGCTESADAERAYEESGCRTDCEETYRAFVSMRYSYTFVEKAAREGYVLHGQHRDDVPVEIITTDASQNGANGVFGGGYSHTIQGNSLKVQAFGAIEAPERKGDRAESADYYGRAVPVRRLMAVAKDLVEYGDGFIQDQDPTEDVGEQTWKNTEACESGTPSDAVKEDHTETATPSDASLSFSQTPIPRTMTARYEEDEDPGTSRLFEDTYQQALNGSSCGAQVEKGPSDLYSHGGGKGGEEAWRIYDHRTEGEIHINKRDMALQDHEGGSYSSYGDTQGDAVLEGAVYGLFAAGDLVHPDGITGIVFRQNDLVAITTTDKEGDASFMAITEAPGHTYDYKTGCVTATKEGWNVTAPKNLYIKTQEIDDYTADKAYVRSYLDNERENGNCWIGRPLLLGDYYVKELSRSEGYELSVNGQMDPESNQGYSLEVTIPRGEGSAAVTRAPYVELQSSGEDEDTMPNVINFAVTSQGTGDKGYDMVLELFPKGTRMFRKDTSTREQQVEMATGQKEKKYLFDDLGQPVYQRADADDTYPKRNPDGSFVTEETAVNGVVAAMGTVPAQVIDPQAVEEILKRESDSGNGQNKNDQPLAINSKTSPQFLYIKMKVEEALRECGYDTPKRAKTAEGGTGQTEYSGRDEGIYDNGVRQGETDREGISGAVPGGPAKKTVYGHPIITVELPKQRQDGSPATAGDAILSLIDYYGQHPWYSFGGIHGCEETDHTWQFHLYAGVKGSPANFAVPGTAQGEAVIFHRIPWIPDDGAKSPRWIYVTYKNSVSQDAFGTYEDFRSWETMGQYRCGAVLVSDAKAMGDGTIQSKTVEKNVCYSKGEILRAPDGSPLQAYEWVDVMDVVTQTQEVYTWSEIPVTDKSGILTGHGQGRFTDVYGAAKDDKGEALTVTYKLVLPRQDITLTQAEIDRLPPGCGYEAGDTIGYGGYVLQALGACVQIYLDHESQTMAGFGLYVKPVSLVYPGQSYVYQDGAVRPGEGTRKNPIGVQQRVISQSVKVTKAIESEDGKVMDNFRFKIYLISNLERLFRDEDGNVVWMDRKGREIQPAQWKESYPALVPKLYTKAPHKTTPLNKDPMDSITANKNLYGMEGSFISSQQNPGYTAVLETRDGTYDYEKFFDAMAVADKDKWEDGAPSYTSHRPLGNKVNSTKEAEENAAVSDSVRQFAIDWYLDWEVEKLTKASMAYSDQLYDQALREAIKKAENYLKPFFAYDLDAIYAIQWDPEEGGGKDNDKTTLSADKREAEWCLGVSEVLPYGIYVIVEQQPRYAALEDLKNRHYKIDAPQEIPIPAVYESYEGAVKTPQKMSSHYTYHREMSPEDMAARYQIRFNQEEHVVKAHNHCGDFEIYKYGLSMGDIANGAAEAGEGDYFGLTQSRWKPLANYYNEDDDRRTGNVPYYLTEGMSGRAGVSSVYRYSSVSETGTQDTMAGALKVRDGEYAQALVPWSIKVSDGNSWGEEERGDKGSAYGIFFDEPYKSRLRIEKLDSQTHENILHDRAVFRIYRASRDDSRYGTGEVKTYGERTLITGSRLFLLGMGAEQINTVSRASLGVGELYSGFVPAGTPVCREEDQVILMDDSGKKVGDFRAYTTTRDGAMDSVEEDGQIYGDQNVGYLETPKQLDAGAYVLVEISPPAGYTRTKPVALEIYSDTVAYCKEGDADNLVLATVYKRMGEAKDSGDLARVYIENAPIQLKIEKKKNQGTYVTYKVNGRIDGSLTEIGGNPAYEYAYSQGRYLGYGWKKGTLEYLKQQKDAGAKVELVYHGGIFAGYGYVTVDAQKWREANAYVTGAVMTLYEGLELKPSGDKEDHGYEGLVVERSPSGNVTRMYVREGYAGTRTEFLNTREDREQTITGDLRESIDQERVDKWKKIVDKRKSIVEKAVESRGEDVEEPADVRKDNEEEAGEIVENRQETVEKSGKVVDNMENSVDNHQEIVDGIWDAVMVERPDTDILYYDLGDLDVFTRKSVDGVVTAYGYDMNHDLVELEQLEEDRGRFTPTDRGHSVFAFKGGVPYLELTGGDFTQMGYDSEDKIFTLPQGALLYHLDREGNRDAMVDPHTGMAYVEEGETGRLYVWPVTVTKDQSGRRIGVDKITTSRAAQSGGHGELGYITGSWKSQSGEESHKMMTIIQNSRGENLDGEPISHSNSGLFEKLMRPVVDEHGLPVYFTCSRETYGKETSLYDRDGDFVRKKQSDLAEVHEKASYLAENPRGLDNATEPVYHRFGESYLMENTWITGQTSPDDPFDGQMSQGQADILRRVPAGVYIMEELKAPEGYVKGFPRGMTVEETARVQTGQMVDDSTKVLIQKLDDTDRYQYEVLDMNVTDSRGTHPKIGTLQEGKSSFGHNQTEGAKLTLFKAGDQKQSGSREETRTPILSWETGKEPLYTEGLAQGDYILEETVTPQGFVTGKAMDIQVKDTSQVQIFSMINDHTKVEFEKYTVDKDTKIPLEGAGFTLYEAVVDEYGHAVFEDGKPQYHKDKIADTWVTNDSRVYKGFAAAFEEMYRDYGTSGRMVSWNVDGKDYEAKYMSHQQIDAAAAGGQASLFPTTADIRFRTNEGAVIRIAAYQQQGNLQGRDFVYEYQFDYRKLSHINDNCVSYVTGDGMRRIDYLPAEKNYVLVETQPPRGYGAAADRLIMVENTIQIQRHSVRNQESVLLISKCAGGERGSTKTEELPGAHLALYRADEMGQLIQEPQFLAAQWVSGSDGVYTETDQINGRIPAGYKKGDIRPHELARLPKGVYYLVEEKSPDYYTLMEPVKIVYEQDQQIQIIRARNEMVRGELEIRKTNGQGETLNGVVFELTAYRGMEREPVFEKMLSDHDGIVHVSDLPVGEQSEDGKIIPYRYRLKEVTPPTGYGSDMQIHTFWFDPNHEGESWGSGQKAGIELEIVNDKTRISISKQDFGSPKEWVPGARMAVYQVTGRDIQGQCIYDRERPEDTWVTGPKESHVLEGLTAGGTYLLIEEAAPEGYEKMKPYVFTLSQDGRCICAINSQMGVVTVHSLADGDGIRSVEIQGRYGIKVEMELQDKEGNLVSAWVAGRDSRVLTEAEGIRDNEVYHLTETTVYSDGSREITGRATRRCHLSEQGTWVISERTVDKVRMSLTHEGGEEIKAWNPSELMPRVEVENPFLKESPKIVINGGQGAVKPSELVSVSITCVNTGYTATDMTVEVWPGSEAAVIDPGDGKLEGGQIWYELKQMQPGESCQVGYACQLSPGAKEVTVRAAIRCMGETTEEKKVVPVLLKNRLTVFHEVTGTGKGREEGNSHRFQIFLYRESGEELRGTYQYEGSREGSLQSGDCLTLEANEFVTIDPGNIYQNIRYEVVDVQGEERRKGQVPAETGGCAHFIREVTDVEQTAVFRKGQQYQLLETTYYSDNSARNSGKMRFTIDDKGAVQGIAVMDRKQAVAVSKMDITGREELKGALMQVKKTDGTVLEQWISDKEPHILEAVLVPGQTYILHEELSPEGYGIGEDILFQVKEGECVHKVTMEDKKTHVIFSKKGITGQEEIPGAVMQVLDESGAVVEEWLSGVRPYEIVGKLEAGKTYRLHEELPPDGYGYGEDIVFTVALDGRIDQVEMRDRPTHVEVSKTDITEEKELPGARLEILDEKGSVIAWWISGEQPYKLVGVLKAGCTYTLRESAAPDGYAYTADVGFKVSGDGAVDRVIMRDEATRVKIAKTDKRTGLALAGATLELVTVDGAVAETWTTTEEAHLLEGKLRAGQTYLVREKKAPGGYNTLDKDIYFTVPRKAGTITVEVENEKKPSSPGVPPDRKRPTDEKEPEKIKEPEKTGKVYTDYWSLMEAHGKTSYQTFTNLRLPKMGDEGEEGEKRVWLALAGMACLMVAWIAGKRKMKSFCLILIFIFAISKPVSAFAETVDVQPEGRLVVTGDVYLEESHLPEVLPEVYVYGDVEYVRQSCQVVEAMTEEGAKEVEETITYREVEQTDTLPETAEITVTDERYGASTKKDFPVMDVQFYNWRWIGGFELPLTVEEADAQIYELNGVQVQAREEQPFAGYEKELLNLAQVNPDYYRIREVTWTGPSWVGENGKIYRGAVATGEKYVADCQAVYGGTAVLESVQGVAWQAVYQKAPKDTEPVAETGEEEPWQLHTVATPAVPEPIFRAPERENARIPVRLEQVVFSVGIILLLIPLVMMFIRKCQKYYNSLKR